MKLLTIFFVHSAPFKSIQLRPLELFPPAVAAYVIDSRASSAVTFELVL